MNKTRLSLLLLMALALVFFGCTSYQTKPVSTLGPTPSAYDGNITVSQLGNLVVIGNDGNEPKEVYLLSYDAQDVLRCSIDYKALTPGAKIAFFIPKDLTTLVWESP